MSTNLKTTIQVDLEVRKLIKDNRKKKEKNKKRETINSSLRRLLKMK